MMVPPSDSPEPWELDPATAEAWRERERRQRSVRLLMMFLLMLLLMDGEEQSNRRRNEPLLRRKKNTRKPVILEPIVFRERQEEDEAIFKLTRTHSRFLKLLELNNNVNYEAQARKWADQFIEQQEDAEADDDNEEDERKVLHYPWNATGFYRGEWIRDEVDDEETDDNKEEEHDDYKENSVHFVSPLELEQTMLALLANQNEQIGVFLLPQGIQIDVDNITARKFETTTDESAKQDILIQRSSRSPFMRYSEFATTTEKENQQSFPLTLGKSARRSVFSRYSEFTAFVEEEDEQSSFRLPLTKSTGRAALQLYSRSVPAVKELSIVEGFVKLYDSNTVGYSTSRDILLRARGVLIHSIGRLSLVSNAVTGRASLVISDQSTVPTKLKNEKESADETEGAQRTRLLNALENVHSESDEKLLDQIRRDVMFLYPFDGMKENFKGWDKLASISEFDDDTHDLNEVSAEYNEDERSSWLKEIVSKFWNFGEEQGEISSRRSLLQKDEGTMDLEAIDSHSDDDNSTTRITVPLLDLDHLNATNTTLSVEARRMQVNAGDVNVGNKEGGLDEGKVSKVVFPFPYVRDDKSESVRKTKTQASRRMPQREQLLEANAGHCEFEINLDVNEIEWTMGQWKRLMTRRVQESRNSDPAMHMSDPDEADEKEDGDVSKNSSHMKRKHETTETPTNDMVILKPMQDQALVMLMAGAISSPNCDFTASLNVTAIRTDWEHTTGKAINYSFYMMLTCLIQIIVLLRQLLHTQAQSTAMRVSLLCIGWQTVLDALLCLAHVYLSLAMQPLFTAFASVAFFKLLIFCVIEMKYMAIVIHARNSNAGGQNLAEALRRQVAMLHVRFYVALVLAFLAFFYAGQKYRTIYILALYSFWVPQIVQNVITEAKRPLHTYYIYGISITRMVAPLYIFAVPNNFLKEVYPDSPTNVVMCELLVVWVGLQALVLIAQGKYGARFMVPARFLPPKFDYNRPLPSSMITSMMPADDTLEPPLPPRPELSDKKSEPPLLASETSHERTTVGTRNRIKKGKSKAKPETTSMTTESLPEDPHCLTLDCVICCNSINVNNRRGYMLAPCDHIFHRECLVQWMDIKMECPVCRKELPAI